MSRAMPLLLYICNLRVLLLLMLAYWLSALPLPNWVQSLTQRIDYGLYYLAVNYSQMPVPDTELTLIHVPELQYERWLVDLVGAEDLTNVLKLAKNKDGEAQAVVGLVVEQPLSFMKPRSEVILSEIHQSAQEQNFGYEDVGHLIERRKQLEQALAANQLLLGVNRDLPFSEASVNAEWGPLERYPSWLRQWLWPLAQISAGDLKRSPALDHSPLLLTKDLEQSLMIRGEGQVLPAFALRFLNAAKLAGSGGAAGDYKHLEWQRDRGLNLAGDFYPVASDGKIIPLYGRWSNIHAPFRQISLGAALQQEQLSGWLLLGQNGSPTLSAVGQQLAALGDHAYVVEPNWWEPLVKLLAIVLTVAFILLVPRLSLGHAFSALLISCVLLSAVLVVGQIFFNLWLPVSNLMLLCVSAVAVLWLHELFQVRKQQLIAQAEAVRSDYARLLVVGGRRQQAVALLAEGQGSEGALNILYQLGVEFEQGQQWQPAMTTLGAIRRHRRRYKDVNERLKRINQEQQAANEAEALKLAAANSSKPDQNSDNSLERNNSLEPSNNPEQAKQIAQDNQVQAKQAPLNDPSDSPTKVKIPEQLTRTQALPAIVSSKRCIGRYEIKHELGRGATGTVYLAFDPHIARSVAVKTLNYRQFPFDELSEVKERFFREAKAAGRLNHPNITQVFDVGEQGQLGYIAMDYARGSALSSFVSESCLLPVEDVYQIARDVAEALAYAHEQNVIHRDIKPGNIICNAEPLQVKVTDFGIARLVDHSHTSTGEILGSPLYMAPEQLLGHKVGPSSDIFSLGVTFYQLLCGHLPFNGDNLASLTYEIIHSKHKSVRTLRKDLPTSAVRICNLALQKKPGDRFESAAAMADAIKKALKRDFSIA